jgi:hypothetical protein
MTHLQLICLLLVYLFVVALHATLSKLTPLYGNEPRKDYLKEYLSSHRIPKWYNLLVCIVGSSVALGGVVGMAGLFLLWRQAPVIYCSALLGKVFLSPVLIPIPNRNNCWEDLCSGLELMLDGFLMALIFFGPAKHLFY